MGLFAKIYTPVIWSGILVRSPLLLALRLYWGFAFFKTGYGKLMDIQKIIDFFTELNIPYPIQNAYIAASIECFGGLLLMAGLLSRLASIPLTFIMCIAYVTAGHDALINVFNDPETFIAQTPFLFLLTALVVWAFGPGAFSLDYLFGIECSKTKCQS